MESMMKAEKDYLLISLRVNGCYLWLNIIQIVFTICLLLTLFLHANQFIGIIEIWIGFLIALDLLLRYFSEGWETFGSKMVNNADMVILAVIIMTIGLQVITPEKLHEDQNMLAMFVMILRYLLQFYRLFRLLLQSHETLESCKPIDISLDSKLEDEQFSGMRSSTHSNSLGNMGMLSSE